MNLVEVDIIRTKAPEAFLTFPDQALLAGEFIDISSLKIKIFPEEFSLSQFSEITFSNIPQKSNISIYDSFGTLVYSEKSVSGSFEWDAENNDGDQVLFGLYTFVLYNPMNKILFERSFRVIP